MGGFGLMFNLTDLLGVLTGVNVSGFSELCITEDIFCYQWSYNGNSGCPKIVSSSPYISSTMRAESNMTDCRTVVLQWV